LAEVARANAHMLDSLLHPSPISRTEFESAPLKSKDEKPAPDYFSPEPIANSYIQVAECVVLMTETERMAAEEQAHTRAAAMSGPRKYLVFQGSGNTGNPLARYQQQTPKSCLHLCELDARCVGFTVAITLKDDDGLCTLREGWGANIENPKYDSYQAHDYTVDRMPYKDLVVFPKTSAQQKLFVMADVTRVRPQRSLKSSELDISVDHHQPAAIWTNVPANYDEPEAYSSVSWAGVSHMLRAGDHTVRVHFSRASEPILQGDARAGCQQQRLTAVPLPIELGMARVYDIVGEHWNIGATSAISAQTYTDIPSPEMKISVGTATDDARLFVIADINRVQHSHGWTNTAIRVLVDGQEIGFTNTGEHLGWQYRAISLRATSKPLKAGAHTVQVQAMTQQGRVYFINDGNGYQQRRLMALVVPGDLIWDQTWNMATSWLNSRMWTHLPGAEMQLTMMTSMAGRLFVNVGISRVQSWGTDNVEFRILVDGQEISRTNTGNVNGWRFRDIAFHGVTELLQPGEHKVLVQFRSRAASTVVFYNDGNGWQQRRLAAILFSAGAGLEHIKQFDNSGFCKNQK